MISPFKVVVGDAYKAVESRLLTAIHLHFGLPAQPGAALTRLIKRADRQAAYVEATLLAGFSRAEAVQFFGRPDPMPETLAELVKPWPIVRSQAAYRERVLTLQSRGRGSRIFR